MKDDNYLDNIFKQKLESYDSGTPTHLWDKIEHSRNWKYRTTSFVKKYWYLPVAILALFLIGNFVYTSTTKNTIPDTTIQQAIVEPTSEHSTEPKTQEILQEEETKVFNNHNTVNNKKNQLKKIEYKNKAHFDITPSTLDLQKKKVVSTPIQKITKKITAPIINNAVSAQPLQQLEGKPTLNINKDQISYQSSISKNVIQRRLEQPIVESKPVIIEKQESTNAKSIKFLSQKDVVSEATNEIAIPPAIANPLISGLETMLELPDPTCYSFKGKLSVKTYLDLLVAPDFAIRTLEPSNPDVTGAYANQRDSLERSQYAWSAGLRFSAIFGNRFALRTGLNYSQINEIFEYENGNSTITITTTTILPDGTPQTTIETQTGTRYMKIYNRLRMLDIPLIAGYEMDMDKFKVSLNGGAFLNIIFLQKGRTIAPNNLPVDFSSNLPDPYPIFNKRVGITYFGSLALSYDINDKFALLAEPYVKYQPESLTLADYPLDQKYTTVGLNLGLRYKF